MHAKASSQLLRSHIRVLDQWRQGRKGHGPQLLQAIKDAEAASDTLQAIEGLNNMPKMCISSIGMVVSRVIGSPMSRRAGVHGFQQGRGLPDALPLAVGVAPLEEVPRSHLLMQEEAVDLLPQALRQLPSTRNRP